MRTMLGLATLLLGAAACAATPRLPSGVVDPALGVSVSGISSGGYMAVQMHFAHAETFRQGAGVVAGGPLACAEGDVTKALGRCMAHSPAIPVDALVRSAREAANQGRLAPLAQLSGSRVYLFSGRRDETVHPGVVADLQRFYAAFLPATQIVAKMDVPADHSFVTDDFGPACAQPGSHYLNDCDFDLAGHLLGALHHPVDGRLPRPRAASALLTAPFDQREFVTGHAMLDQGRVYVPATCTARSPCGLHVALHGCRQNTKVADIAFTDHAGFNRWAETNRLVVLYPQAAKTSANPNGCWDWWGHDDPRHATRQGPQVRAVMAMVHRLMGHPADAPVAACATASNWTHYWADRAATDGFGRVFAKGSGQALGWWWQTTTLREWPTGQFATGRCD